MIECVLSRKVSLTDGVKTEVPRLYVGGDFSGYTRETNLLFFL